MIGLFFFGKKHSLISRYYVSTSPFALAFSKGQNLKTWAAVDAAPPTSVCLKDKKVWREIGDSDDGMNKFILEVPQANSLAVRFLKVWSTPFGRFDPSLSNSNVHNLSMPLS